MQNNNLGSVYFDKNKNRWISSYYIHDDITNEKKRAKKLFKSEIEAKEFLDRYNLNDGKIVEQPEYTLKELLDKILYHKFKSHKISDKQFSLLSGINKNICKENFSNKKIKDITFEELNNYFNSLERFSDSYIKKIYNQLCFVFKYSITNGFIINNPMLNINKPKSIQVTRKVKSLIFEEEYILNKYLLSADILEFPYKNVYLLILNMGLRVGEVLALKLKDVDLVRNTISINKILITDANDKSIIKENYINSRILKINKQIKESLKQQLNIARANPNNFLFLSKNHTLVNPGTINKILQKTMSRLGSNNIQTQSLRYTYRDNLLKDGLKHEEITKIMGPINFE